MDQVYPSLQVHSQNIFVRAVVGQEKTLKSRRKSKSFTINRFTLTLVGEIHCWLLCVQDSWKGETATLESIFGLCNVLQLFSNAFNKIEEEIPKISQSCSSVFFYRKKGEKLRGNSACLKYDTKEHLVTLNIIDIWQVPTVRSHLEIQARTLPNPAGCPTAHSCNTSTSICTHRREEAALMSPRSWQNGELQVFDP